MSGKISDKIMKEIDEIREAGLYKEERIIMPPHSAHIRVKQGKVINFCANNYLGLASDPRVVKAAYEGLEKYGFGYSEILVCLG